MSSALDNLLANAGMNNMLGDGGMFRQGDYYNLWLRSLKRQNPVIGTAVDIANADYGSSDSDYQTPQSKPWSEYTEKEKYIDTAQYYNDDFLSKQNVLGFMGNVSGVPGMTTAADYLYGKNISGDVGGFLGGMLGVNYAKDPATAMIYSNLGGMAGESGAVKAAKSGLFGKDYKNEWGDKYSGVGSLVSKVVDYSSSSTERDKMINNLIDFQNKEDVSPEKMYEIESQMVKDWTEPSNQQVEIIEGSVNDNARNILDDPATIVSEPESVNDFVGMFSNTIDGVGDWFSRAYDGITGKFTGMQNEQAGVETPKVGYGKQGDDTWQDNTGTVFHGSGYNWNASDDSSSTSTGTDFSGSSNDGSNDWSGDEVGL
jgi:hypothetical protein